MKIIVDEMPENPKDCLFNVGNDDENICLLNKRCKSINANKCEYLKPITDFHAEEVIQVCSNGTKIVKDLDIK